MTLNLLVGLNGVSYFNTVNGATDSFEFVNIFAEAYNQTQENGEPVISRGDTIIFDNCPTHHSAHGKRLQDWLFERGVETIFTPTYS